MSVRRKNRSRLRRKRGTHSRLSRSLSVGAIIALVALVSTFVLDQSSRRGTGETFTDSLVSPAPGTTGTSATGPVGKVSAEDRESRGGGNTQEVGSVTCSEWWTVTRSTSKMEQR